jgi:hypothetical protein
MRSYLLVLFAACSNAADPAADASHADVHVDSQLVDAARPDAPAALHLLVVNEVAAGETVDWFEIVNATTAPIQLSDFIFVDAAGDFAKAVAFPATTLGPGAYAAQDCDGTIVPFKLASDEELWVYRASDHALSDGVDWAAGDSPTGGSYARMPDIFGPFQTTTTQTKGAHN